MWSSIVKYCHYLLILNRSLAVEQCIQNTTELLLWQYKQLWCPLLLNLHAFWQTWSIFVHFSPSLLPYRFLMFWICSPSTDFGRSSLNVWPLSFLIPEILTVLCSPCLGFSSFFAVVLWELPDAVCTGGFVWRVLFQTINLNKLGWKNYMTYKSQPFCKKKRFISRERDMHSTLV